MCGIAGLLAPTVGEDEAAALVERMVASLRHRGPDDAGVAAGAGWAIGMRRLAVQDLSRDGHQPMDRGPLSIVFNGEVYNFPELREQLRREHGFEFRSGTDTEVVLRALQVWGPAALERFNGMFALALIDRERRTALLARDRFGKKPMFVARLRQGIAFASELKAILEIGRGQLSVDRDALAGYFRHLYVPSPAAIFGGVAKLPAASWQTVDLDTGEVGEPQAFYRLPAGAANGTPVTAQAVLDTVREATRRRLIADVPVGAFLSGGIDSSLVVACMTDLVPDVRTFSIGFTDKRYDESAYALAVAGELGTAHTHHVLTPQDALDSLGRLIEAFDEPFADRSAVATLAVSELARRDVTVALSGDGGDEIFGGYDRYRLSRPLSLAAAVPAPLGRRLARLPVVEARRPRLQAALAAASPGEAYQEQLAVWKARDLERLVPGARPAATVARLVDEAPGGPVEKMMRADLRTYLVDDILQKVDRSSMSFSLEARNPLLDPEVVALGLRAAAVAEAAPGEKRLLRDALRLRLPDRLIDRPKRGFSVPVSDWLRAELRPLVEDLVMSRTDAEYDVRVARQLAEDHLSGRRVAGWQLWSLLTFELWRERWA